MNRTIRTFLIAPWLAAMLSGCSSFGPERAFESSAPPPGWNRLRVGMGYGEVMRTLGRHDPSLRETLRDVMDQEVSARKEYQAMARQVQSQTGGTLPPMTSTFQIDHGEYQLVFNNGRLAEWQCR